MKKKQIKIFSELEEEIETCEGECSNGDAMRVIFEKLKKEYKGNPTDDFTRGCICAASATFTITQSY